MALIQLLAQSVIKLVGITSLVYIVLYCAPGHIAIHGVEKERSLGHAVIDYVEWGGKMLTGDWGHFKDGTKISERLKQHIPRTLLLVSGSLVISLVIALLMVIVSLRWQHMAIVRSSITIVNLLSGIHIIVLSYVFISFDWARPNQQEEDFSIWLLVILAFGNGALVDYFSVLHTQVSKALSQDYVSAALARGAGRLRHAMRYEIVLAIVEATSSRIPSLVGGTIIVEYVFAYNGIGFDIIKAVENRDFDLTMGVTTAMAILLIGITDITQFLRHRLDPKLHH